MDVGKFAKAYVGQMQVNYAQIGNNYGGPDALDYVECTAVEYNDKYVSFLVLIHVVILYMCMLKILNLIFSLSPNYNPLSIIINSFRSQVLCQTCMLQPGWIKDYGIFG